MAIQATAEEPFSVNRLYARAIVQSAGRNALSLPKALLQEVEDQPRLPLATLDGLWDSYCAASHDPLAGLRLGLALQPGHLDCAGMLLASCETLGEALQQLAEVAPIIGEGGDFSIDEWPGHAAVRYQPHMAVRRAERVEAALAGLLRLILWASGDRFRPNAMRFEHRPLAPTAQYRALLGIETCFDAGVNALVFGADQLDLPFIQANSTLHRHLRHLTDRMLADLAHASLSAEVQRIVRANPRWGKERVAERLHLSGRHLNRRLAEEGTSFKLLRDASLHAVAAERLRGPMRVRDIAEDLGFSDEGAFTRAFRRWTGLTPAGFRRQADERR